MDMKDKIEVTGVDMKKFVQEVYALSRPQGMGFIHFEEGPLPDDLADAIVAHRKDDSYIALSMDYVKGRACKMVMWRDGDKLVIRNTWFDHHPDDLRELLERVGMADRQKLVA